MHDSPPRVLAPQHRRAERAMAFLARLARVLTAPFVRYDIRGGACAAHLHVGVVAVNHRSLFDVVAGLIGLHHFRRYPRLLIAEKYVRSAWTAPFARWIGAIPVPAGSGRNGVIDAGIGALRSGVPVLVMPEGRLHDIGGDPLSLATPRAGVSRLAVGSGTVVVTAALTGTEQVWPPGHKVPRMNPFRRRTVIIRVCDEPLELTGEDHDANAALVMEDIRRMLAIDLAGTLGGGAAVSELESATEA